LQYSDFKRGFCLWNFHLPWDEENEAVNKAFKVWKKSRIRNHLSRRSLSMVWKKGLLFDGTGKENVNSTEREDLRIRSFSVSLFSLPPPLSESLFFLNSCSHFLLPYGIHLRERSKFPEA
jgi:hypothetical protein